MRYTKKGILCSLLVGILAAPASGEWKGKEVVQDGVTIVHNPESPVEEVTIELKELWRVGGAEDEDTLFGVISQLTRDENGELYLLDSQLSEIQVYSSDGEHQRTIGREGEGPGEFRNASDLYFGPGGALGVVQVFPGKVVLLQPDGTPAGSFELPAVEGGGFQLVFQVRGLQERVVLAGGVSKQIDGQQMQLSYLKSYDPEGNELAHFHEELSEMRFGGMEFDEKTFSNFVRRWALADDGRVAAALEFDAYRIHLWDKEGKLLRIIERPQYQLLKRSGAEKKRFQRMWDGFTSWNPGSTFKISETHQTINQVTFREDGSLWVLSSEGSWKKPDEVLASWDVYDRQGRYVRKVNLVGDGDPLEDGLFFVGDRLYVVTDLLSALMANFGGDSDEEEVEIEEPEPVAVIAYQVEPSAIGMK